MAEFPDFNLNYEGMFGDKSSDCSDPELEDSCVVSTEDDKRRTALNETLVDIDFDPVAKCVLSFSGSVWRAQGISLSVQFCSRDYANMFSTGDPPRPEAKVWLAHKFVSLPGTNPRGSESLGLSWSRINFRVFSFSYV